MHCGEHFHIIQAAALEVAGHVGKLHQLGSLGQGAIHPTGLAANNEIATHQV